MQIGLGGENCREGTFLCLVWLTIKRDRNNLRPFPPIDNSKPLLDNSTSDATTPQRVQRKFPRFRVKIDDFKIKMSQSLRTHQEQSVVKMSVVVETKQTCLDHQQQGSGEQSQVTLRVKHQLGEV